MDVILRVSSRGKKGEKLLAVPSSIFFGWRKHIFLPKRALLGPFPRTFGQSPTFDSNAFLAALESCETKGARVVSLTFPCAALLVDVVWWI